MNLQIDDPGQAIAKPSYSSKVGGGPERGRENGGDLEEVALAVIRATREIQEISAVLSEEARCGREELQAGLSSL